MYTSSDLVHLKELATKISGYNKPYQSPEEKRWFTQIFIIARTYTDFIQFDDYGNLHARTKSLDHRQTNIIYVAEVNEKQPGEYSLTEEFPFSVVGANAELDKIWGTAILLYMLQTNVPGYYIFKRSGPLVLLENFRSDTSFGFLVTFRPSQPGLPVVTFQPNRLEPHKDSFDRELAEDTLGMLVGLSGLTAVEDDPLPRLLPIHTLYIRVPIRQNGDTFSIVKYPFLHAFFALITNTLFTFTKRMPDS